LNLGSAGLTSAVLLDTTVVVLLVFEGFVKVLDIAGTYSSLSSPSNGSYGSLSSTSKRQQQQQQLETNINPYPCKCKFHFLNIFIAHVCCPQINPHMKNNFKIKKNYYYN